MQRYWDTCALLLGMQNISATMENNMDVPQKCLDRTTIVCSNPASDIYPKELK